MGKRGETATSESALCCSCGFECKTGGEMYRHRKTVHGDDGSVAYAYAGSQIGKQRRAEKLAKRFVG